jgi:hypothetical protein
MRASHKIRLDRLCASLDDVEEEAVDRRSMLRFETVGCRLIRDAMLRAGVDPACAAALGEAEARVAGFVDRPELQRADADARAAETATRPPCPEGQDPRERLIAHLDDIGRHYLGTGTLPDFRHASFLTLLGWASPPLPDGSGAQMECC